MSQGESPQILTPADVFAVSWRSIAATHRLAAALARSARVGDVLSLDGPLGAGKTTFTAGFVAALPGAERVHVCSPTFTSVNTYETDIVVYHIDLYRLSENIDPDMLGYEEYFEGDGVCLVEWLERAPFLAPDDHLRLRFLLRSRNSRRLQLSAGGPRSARWMADALKIFRATQKK